MEDLVWFSLSSIILAIAVVESVRAARARGEPEVA
jgi:hypothetical protein